MKTKLKKIIRIIVYVPNIPFFIILSVYIFIMLHKHTNIVDLQLMDGEDMVTDEIKEHIRKIFPKQLEYIIALFFYMWIILNIV